MYVIKEFNLLYLGFLLHVVVVYISDVLYKGNEEQIENKQEKKPQQSINKIQCRWLKLLFVIIDDITEYYMHETFFIS